jgi:GWxTD domain-containing protein
MGRPRTAAADRPAWPRLPKRVRPRSPLATLAGSVLLALALAVLGCSTTGTGSVTSSLAELTNPFLGPDSSDWLVGPISRIATADEIKSFLALRDDAAAAAFIQQFWERRNPRQGAANSVLATFEERCEVADRKFAEGGLLGRRTDRGTILVLYGTPMKTGFEVAPAPNQSAIEVWRYSPSAPAGLDGKHPDELYRFTRRGELTVLYVPRPGSQPLVPVAAPPP